MKNIEKVLNYLVDKSIEVNSTKIAEDLGINPKNIGRYLKELVSQGLIRKEFLFEGNTRYSMFSATNRISTTRKNEIMFLNKDVQRTEKGTKYRNKIRQNHTDKSVNMTSPSEVRQTRPSGFTYSVVADIRFLSWFAKQLNIKNYSRMNLSKLKQEIGKKLLNKV